MYTEQDIQRIRDIRKEKEHLEMLKAIRDKIKKGIEQINNRSGERAVWELIQNARDLSEHAIIKIVLKKDSIVFSHQGEAFNIDTLSNLIKQQSTKHEGEETVGQYGTGFMTTHAFSRKVYISGDCHIDDENGSGTYITLPEGFCLDRSSDEERPFIDEMKRELAFVDDLIGRINEGHPEPCLWTSFTYPLEQEGKAEKISAQLEVTMRLMPYVLAFNDRIEQCTIDNEITGENVCFNRIKKDVIPLPYTDDSVRAKNIISRKTTRFETLLEINTLESANGEDRIVIPPLPLDFDDVTVIPSQFIFFPLLGTENFGTNFIFHSSRLYPTELRDSFLLPKDNDGLIAKFHHNEAVFGELLDMLFTYYDNNPSEQCLPIGFAKIDFKYENETDTVTKEYLKKLQDAFVEHFIHWKMIPTDKGFLSINDDDGFVVLNHDIYATLSDEAINNYIPALATYTPSSLILPSDNIVGWSLVVYGWKPDQTGYYIDLDSICKGIKGKGDMLKSFLLLLKELGQPGTDMLVKYALIPNREGDLQKAGNLMDAQDITAELYAIAKPLLGQRVSKLVDPNYAEITILPKYDRTGLKDDLKIEIDELKKLTIKRTQNPVSLDDCTGLDVKLCDLITFCSAYPKEGTDTFRSRILPIICRIYGVKYETSVIPPLSDDEADFYLSAFNFLIDNTLFVLSGMPDSWLTDEVEGQSRLTLLKEFLTEFTNTTDNDRLKKLDEYGIIPNQNLTMCLPNELMKNEGAPIPTKILDLYVRLAATVSAKVRDYRDILVHEDFSSFYEFSTCKASDITEQMESMLREKDDDYSWENTRKIVLDIIEGIDNEEWSDKDIFRDIRAKKPTIFFKNAVSGDKGKHVYTLMRQDETVIEDLATLAEEPCFAEIVMTAKALVLERQQEEADFKFKKEIGTHIESLLRGKLSNTLNMNSDDYEFSVEDVQNGQDIVIRYKGNIIYYIEVKTKWNFTTSGPAYMSKNQVLKACSHSDRYALCCVDLTNYGLSDRVYPDSIEKIVDRIKFHFEIGNTLGALMKPTFEANKTPEDLISIDGDYKARIPAKIFRQGGSLENLVDSIISKAGAI